MEICKNRPSNMDIQIRGTHLEQVHRFRYLGTIIQANGGCDEGIKARLAMGRMAFEKKKRTAEQRIEYKDQKQNHQDLRMEYSYVCM